MRAILRALALVTSLAAGRLAAQDATTFRVDKCRSPTEPIGLVTASGRVAFLLGTDGHPDTASIRVIEVETVSPAAYRSVAARLLSACRFRVPNEVTVAPVPVSLTLDLKGSAERPPDAVLESALPEGVELGAVLLPTEGLPLSWDDGRLEEYPVAARNCKAVFVGGPPSGIYTSFTNLQAAMNAWGRRRHARVTVTLEVRRDGSVPIESIRFEQAVNMGDSAKLAAELSRCSFVPGRIGGEPIDAEARFRLGNLGVR